MKHCRHCDQKNSASARFCVYCGQALEGANNAGRRLLRQPEVRRVRSLARNAFIDARDAALDALGVGEFVHADTG